MLSFHVSNFMLFKYPKCTMDIHTCKATQTSIFLLHYLHFTKSYKTGEFFSIAKYFFMYISIFLNVFLNLSFVSKCRNNRLPNTEMDNKNSSLLG